MNLPCRDEAKLQELGRVAASYGRFGQLGHGLGTMPMAVCLLAAGWADWRGSTHLPTLLVACAPPLSIVASVAARHRYQRHGKVVPELEPNVCHPTGLETAVWIGRFLLGFWIACSALLLSFALYFRGLNSMAVGPALSLSSAVLTASLLRLSRPRKNDVFVNTLAMIGLQTLFLCMPADRPWWTPGFLSLMGTLLGATGVVRHVKYLRLERCLGSLQAPL